MAVFERLIAKVAETGHYTFHPIRMPDGRIDAYATINEGHSGKIPDCPHPACIKATKELKP